MVSRVGFSHWNWWQPISSENEPGCNVIQLRHMYKATDLLGFFYYYTARYDQYDQNKIIHAQILSYFRKGIPLKKKTPVGYKQQSILKIEVREFLIFSSHHFTFYSVQSCNALFQPINLQLLKIQNQEIPYWTIEGILFCKETT